MADGAGALRLTFRYSGRHVELVGVEPVEAVVPTPPPSERGRTGTWLEVAEPGGRLLLRRVLHDPFRESIELLGDDPDGPFTRTTVEDSSGTFDVMVPAAEDGVDVAVFHVDPDGATPEGEYAPLATFPLRPPWGPAGGY